MGYFTFALAAWLLLNAAIVVAFAATPRRRRRRPCVVVDLQAVALERARRATRGQIQDSEGGSR